MRCHSASTTTGQESRRADRAKIWEPFWRAPGSAEGGTGLGLAIVRDLVTLHGGTATVETAGARGARFVATFATPHPPDVAAVDFRRAHRGPAGMTRILIVEDNADLAVGLRNNLEIEGYDVDDFGQRRRRARGFPGRSIRISSCSI